MTYEASIAFFDGLIKARDFAQLCTLLHFLWLTEHICVCDTEDVYVTEQACVR